MKAAVRTGLIWRHVKKNKCSVAYVVLHFPNKYADCVTLTSLISPTIKQTLKQRCCYSDNGGGLKKFAFHHFVCEFCRICYFINCDSYAVLKGCKHSNSFIFIVHIQPTKQTNWHTDEQSNHYLLLGVQDLIHHIRKLSNYSTFQPLKRVHDRAQNGVPVP